MSCFISSHPMPICYCQFAGCNGTNISVPAFNKHKREDKIAMFQNAVELTGRISRRQDGVIGDYLTSGSRHCQPAQSGEPHARSSRIETYQHMINTRLHQLSIIEKKVENLVTSTEWRLLNLGLPRSREEPFPLSSSTASVREMFHELSSITS